MSKDASQRYGKRRWGCLAFLALAVLVLLVGVLGYLILRSREGRWMGPAVSIRQPLHGSRWTLEHGGVVVIEASGPEPIQRYELWVDGSRYGVIRPSEGQPALPGETQLRWVPADEGIHSLIALAYDGRGLQGRSRPVIVEASQRDPQEPIGVRVDVQPGEDAASIAARSGLDPDLVAEILPPDAPPGEAILPIPRDRLPAAFFGEDGVEPGSPWREAPPPEADYLPPGMPSPAASLTAEPAGGCQVSLAWQLEDRPDGLRLYRYGGMADDFTSVAELDPQLTQYTDSVRWGGSYLYVIATVGRRGENPGPMKRVEVPAQDCPDEETLPESGLAWIQFEGMRVITQEAFDRLYCYFSLDGGDYQRIPAGKDSSLPRAEDGWDLTPYLAGLHRRVFEHDVQTPVGLRLECWGWRGDELIPVGALDDLRPRQDWRDDLTASSPGLQLLFSLLAYQNDLPVLDQELIEADEPPPPPYNVRLGEGPLECLTHVNLGGGADLYAGEGVLSQWACLEIPEQMLTWDWPSEDGWAVSDIDGYAVEVVQDWDDFGPDEHWTGDLRFVGTSGSANMALPVSFFPPCLRTYAYRVRAYREAEPRRLYSDWSPVLLLSPSGCTEAAYVEFELLELEVDDLDDGCLLFCDGESLQAYGTGEWSVIRSPWYSAATGDFSVWTHDAQVTFWSEECGAGAGEGCLVQPRTVHNGTIDFVDEDLRICHNGGCSGFGPGHNTVRLVLYHGDKVEFRFVLWDIDGVEDDVWCGTTEDIGVADRLRVGTGRDRDYESVSWIVGEYYDDERTLREWAEAGFTDTFYNYGHNWLSDQDAECTITMRVRGLGLVPGPP